MNNYYRGRAHRPSLSLLHAYVLGRAHDLNNVEKCQLLVGAFLALWHFNLGKMHKNRIFGSTNFLIFLCKPTKKRARTLVLLTFLPIRVIIIKQIHRERGIHKEFQR